MHNCNGGPSASKKAFFPNYVQSAVKKSGNTTNLKSSSFFDNIPSNEEYASSGFNSQTSQNISTQTNFKSTTSVNIKTYRKVDIYKERCTQTSKTVIALTEVKTPRYSPDSLSPKQEPSIADADRHTIMDNINLSTAELDYVTFERKNNLTHYLSQCETDFDDLLTGDALTRAYMTKNKNKLCASQAWISNTYRESNTDSLKSQSFIESPCKNISISKKVLSRFKVKKVKEKPDDVAPGKTPPEKNKRSLSFMSPTISSESKDQSLEIESIQKLISPTRKGRSYSPRNKMAIVVPSNPQAKKVPYIDSSNATIGLDEVKNSSANDQLILNLKQSCEVSL